jgi:hypothetical protein
MKQNSTGARSPGAGRLDPNPTAIQLRLKMRSTSSAKKPGS